MERNKSTFTKVVFGIYLFLLVWAILFKFSIYIGDMSHVRNINLIPFGDSLVVNDRLSFEEIIFNVLIFVPFGIYLSILKEDWNVWKKLLVSLGLSFGLEVIQYAFAIGASDITDVINNCAGAVLGVGIYYLLKKLFKEKTVNIINVAGLILIIGFIGFIMLLTFLNF